MRAIFGTAVEHCNCHPDTANCDDRGICYSCGRK